MTRTTKPKPTPEELEARRIEREIRQRWATPMALVRGLEVRLEGLWRAALDVCAEPSTAKAERYYTKEMDGLALPWDDDWWDNPPHATIPPWVDRSLRVESRGLHLLPPRTDQPWWHTLLRSQDAKLCSLKGRVACEPPPGVKATTAKGPLVIWAVRVDVPSSLDLTELFALGQDAW